MKIEKGIEIPETYERVSWPFKDMEVGDCVRFEQKELAYKARNQAHVYGEKTGKKFVTKTMAGVLHIWRIS